MAIRMNSFGSFLCTRVSGRAAYGEIMSASSSLAEKVVFDFNGAETVTNSFADEVFGRMANEMGFEALRQRTSFINIDKLAASTIRRAIDFRSSEGRIPAAA